MTTRDPDHEYSNDDPAPTSPHSYLDDDSFDSLTLYPAADSADSSFDADHFFDLDEETDSPSDYEESGFGTPNRVNIYGQDTLGTPTGGYSGSSAFSESSGYSTSTPQPLAQPTTPQYSQPTSTNYQDSFSPSGFTGTPQSSPFAHGQVNPVNLPNMPALDRPAMVLASWAKRMQAGLIDYLLPSLVLGVLVPYHGDLLLMLIVAANVVLLGGRDGRTLGKRIANIRTVTMSEGRPISYLTALLRLVAHFLDLVLCFIGFFWPIWDRNRQTFADKVCNTVVVED